MNHTKNYGLPQWELNDLIRMEDFNSAMSNIENGLNSNKSAAEAGKKLSNLFRFCGEVFPDGQELLILVTELTLNPHCARFIGRYGCKEYYERNKELLFYERQQEIIRKMEDIDWELAEV